MSKTPYSNMAQLLSDIRFYCNGKAKFEPLLSKHDLAFALADLVRFDYVDTNVKGDEMLDECYEATCKFLGIDSELVYEEANQMLDHLDASWWK
jgi:hypothetical protein